MTTNPQPTSLWGALAKAQAQVVNPQKDAVNEYAKYSYSTIGSVLDAAKDALGANGLTLIHGGAEIDCVKDTGLVIAKHMFVLAHECGESFQFQFQIPFEVKGKTPADKSMLACTTAVRRYAYMSILGMSTGDEPDIDQRRDSVSRERVAPTPAPKNHEYITGVVYPWKVRNAATERKDGTPMVSKDGEPVMRVDGTVDGVNQCVWCRDEEMFEAILAAVNKTPINANFDVNYDKQGKTNLTLLMIH